MMTLLAAATLLLTRQNIDVSVDVAPNETISGLRHFRVTATSTDPITQVEFYVGTELRDSDSSIPYEFNLDTIEEKDGKLELTFAAYTSKGDSAKKVIDVNVDNGVSQGADAHVQKGIDFLHDSKWDDAIFQARIALKIAPDSNPARMVMARAFLGQGVLDKAEKFAEDWHSSDPSSTDASELLTDIQVHRAFFTLSRGQDRMGALKSIQSAFKSAIDMRQTVLQQQLDKIGSPSADQLLNYADVAIAARRYSLAIKALQDEYRRHVERNEVTNRLAFAQLMSGRTTDAFTTLSQVRKLAKLDAYGNALMAVIQTSSHDDKSAEASMNLATQIDDTDVGVKTAQAYMAMHARNTNELARVTADLLNDHADKPEANFYADVLAGLRGNFEDGRPYFETMIYEDPLCEAGYLQEGYDSLWFAMNGSKADRSFRALSAQAMFETALEVRPESYRALLGMSFVALMLGNNDNGLKFANAAVKAAPTQPSALFTLSAALQANNKPSEAYDADRSSWKYDRTTLNGRAVPKPIEALSYFLQYDRMPVITPPR